MQASQYSTLFMRGLNFLFVKSDRPCIVDAHTISIKTLCYQFLRRKFYSSPHWYLRGSRKDLPLRVASQVGFADSIDVEEVSAKKLMDDSITSKDLPENPEDHWTSNPYKSMHKVHRMQGSYFVMPKRAVAKETTIIMFPGQGTQFVGMGKKLLEYPNVKEMYEQASEILRYDILKLSCEGPADQLNQTKYQQPAIFLASLAAVEKLRDENPNVLESCIGTAGFSIGEITALTFANAINFWSAMHLVKARAEAMQIACDITRSGMMVVFYPPDSRVNFACSVAKEYCQKSGLEDVDCRVANFLHPACKVIAGNEEALQFIINNKDDFRINKIKRLAVSGAFHTDLMKPAALVVQEVLDTIHVSKPDIPVYSNFDGKPYKDAKHIYRQLPKQTYSPVRWEQTLHILYQRGARFGYPTTYECGPGSSLKTILKNVNKKAWEHCFTIEA